MLQLMIKSKYKLFEEIIYVVEQWYFELCPQAQETALNRTLHSHCSNRVNEENLSGMGKIDKACFNINKSILLV